MSTGTVLVFAIAISVCVGVVWGIVIARLRVRGPARVGVGVVLAIGPMLLGALASTLLAHATHQAYIAEQLKQLPRYEKVVTTKSKWFIPVRTVVEVHEPNGARRAVANVLVAERMEKPPQLWLAGGMASCVIVWFVAGLTWFLARSSQAADGLSA